MGVLEATQSEISVCIRVLCSILYRVASSCVLCIVYYVVLCCAQYNVLYCVVLRCVAYCFLFIYLVFIGMKGHGNDSCGPR